MVSVLPARPFVVIAAGRVFDKERLANAQTKAASPEEFGLTPPTLQEELWIPKAWGRLVGVSPSSAPVLFGANLWFEATDG